MPLLTEDVKPTRSEIAIREFQPGDAADFRRLNEEWITLYFKLEPKDRYTLEHPEETILAKGGRIFFAIREGVALGTVALIPIAPNEYEVAKMGVTANVRGLGIGSQLMQATVEAARASGATRLYLETNHALLPAIRVYTAAGFRDVPADRLTPSPYQRADVFMELFL
ncbi:Predicted N-acetyltransferase YhbS [Bryocella elongata]|uniref:Predicted N-acetyltransferase YhbS n=1 Tax=Bryocella elongata TaxID=863522 RepID=A0A1H6BQ85_9BACT|nr:GNAT family N-acetyltransferase [Bryocella elongata]SEG62577.1 Predicted N-acetyltransferase YhbS [Bryocella elongata]